MTEWSRMEMGALLEGRSDQVLAEERALRPYLDNALGMSWLIEPAADWLRSGGFNWIDGDPHPLAVETDMTWTADE